MTHATIAGHSVQLNDDGFMIDAQEWMPDIALGLAPQATLKVRMAAGRVWPIAATSPKRLPAFPDVPTMVGSGYADFVVGAWFGIFAPP